MRMILEQVAFIAGLMNPGNTNIQGDNSMGELQQKASKLRRTLPKNGQGPPPVMKGQLLGTLPHKEGEIR